MATLRFAARLGGIVVWTTVMFSIRLAALALIPINPSWEVRASRWLFQKHARLVWRIVGMRVSLVGSPPRPPFFMVSNHLSYLDIFILAGSVGCVFVSRADAARWPVVGFLIRMMNTILIDRERRRDTVRVNDEIRRAMARGYGVHVFAESRISQDASVQEFKPALLQPAVDMGLPVYYATLYYRTPPGYPGAKDIVVWHDGESMYGNLRTILRLPWLEAVAVFGEEPLQQSDRKLLAQELRTAVTEAFQPLS